ncbi:MAG: hypothetical protein KGI54_06625 [Pseudomonadota bacterium]|nr:hypothetical protein [Pseudomonadota bacterium]
MSFFKTFWAALAADLVAGVIRFFMRWTFRLGSLAALIGLAHHFMR